MELRFSETLSLSEIRLWEIEDEALIAEIKKGNCVLKVFFFFFFCRQKNDGFFFLMVCVQRGHQMTRQCCVRQTSRMRCVMPSPPILSLCSSCPWKKRESLRFVPHKEKRKKRRNFIVFLFKASLHGVLEVRVCRPRLDRLRSLLSSAPYCGKKRDQTMAVPEACNAVSLKTTVQCSDAELSAELDSMGAFELHGRIRVCDPVFEHGLVELLLCLVLEHGWKYAEVPLREAVAMLNESDADEAAVLAVLRKYGNIQNGSVRLDARRISLFKARVLLQSKPVWIVSEFFGSLANALPLSDYFPALKVSDLFGFCMVEEKGALSSIRYFSIDSGDSVESAFAQLFAARTTWPIDQLLPYISPLAGASIEQVLLRYCFVNRMDPKNVTVSKR